MKNRSHTKCSVVTATLLGLALVGATSLPISAQPDRVETKTTVTTYDKEPDSNGDAQDLPTYTYDKKPDSEGDDQDLEFDRYEEENDANTGENPVNLVIIDEGDE